MRGSSEFKCHIPSVNLPAKTKGTIPSIVTPSITNDDDYSDDTIPIASDDLEPINSPPRMNYRLSPRTKRPIPSVVAPTTTNDDDYAPVISYDSDDTIPIASPQPMNYKLYPSPEWEPSHEACRSPSPHSTGITGQKKRDTAVQCLESIANTTLIITWNNDWGPISNWSKIFARQYISAIDENNSAAFIKSVAKQAQVGRQLMNGIALVITDCTLPTSETALKTFVQLLLKLIFRLNKGISVLEDRVRIFSSRPNTLA